MASIQRAEEGLPNNAPETEEVCSISISTFVSNLQVICVTLITED